MNLNDLEKLAKAARSKLEETAAINLAELDLSENNPLELGQLANLIRLYRLADRRYNELVNDHLGNFTSLESADRMVDVLTEQYVMDLPLSYMALSAFVSEMKGAAKKYGINTPSFWDDIIQGQFDYSSELSGEA